MRVEATSSGFLTGSCSMTDFSGKIQGNAVSQLYKKGFAGQNVITVPESYRIHMAFPLASYNYLMQAQGTERHFKRCS